MQYQQTVSSLLCKLGLWIPTKFKDKNYNSTRVTCTLNNYYVLLIVSRLILCQTMWDILIECLFNPKTPDATDDQNCPDSNMDNIDLLQKSNYMKLTKGLLTCHQQHLKWIEKEWTSYRMIWIKLCSITQDSICKFVQISNLTWEPWHCDEITTEKEEYCHSCYKKRL